MPNKVFRIDTNVWCGMYGGLTAYCRHPFFSSPWWHYRPIVKTPAGRKELSLVTYWEANAPKLGTPSKKFHYQFDMKILSASKNGHAQHTNDADPNRKPWAIINQLHQHCEGDFAAHPQFSIEIDRVGLDSYALGGTINLRFILRGNKRKTNESYTYIEPEKRPDYETPYVNSMRRVAYDQTYRVVVDGLVSTGSDGYLKAKIANDVMIDYHGPLGLFPDAAHGNRSCGTGDYNNTFDIRVGAYHSSGTGRLVIDFDNLIYTTSK